MKGNSPPPVFLIHLTKFHAFYRKCFLYVLKKTDKQWDWEDKSGILVENSSNADQRIFEWMNKGILPHVSSVMEILYSNTSLQKYCCSRTGDMPIWKPQHSRPWQLPLNLVRRYVIASGNNHSQPSYLQGKGILRIQSKNLLTWGLEFWGNWSRKRIL